MRLIVAEKPSVGRDIARVLGVTKKGEGYLYGNGYAVTWAIGHLVSLQDPGEFDENLIKWRMDTLPMLPEHIPLKVLPDTRAQYEVVSRLMHSEKIDRIICATDSAREGELIFRYIYEMAKCVKPVDRLWISSMTDAAITAGFAALKPDSEYDALYDSARCRSEADWLVGMNASRAYSLRYDAHLSVGRVQTPTLSLLVKRDREIAAFVPEAYWEVRANFGDYEGLYLNPAPKLNEDGTKDASAETRLWSKEEAQRIQAAVKGKEAAVRESTTERKHFAPPQLFDLTSLQREANNKFGFSADKTLKLAQSLYETHKAVTYPRTDSRYLSDDIAGKMGAIFDHLPAEYQPMLAAPEMNRNMHSKRFYDDTKISDHHAIIPTEKRVNPASLSPDEQKLYDLIARRLIAAHYPDYECESARVITAVGEHRFKSTGTMPLKEGWHAVYQDTGKKDNDTPLPRLSVGDTRKVKGAAVKESKTKAPKAHTDASLLSLMENAGRTIDDETLREQMKDSGLGTPATRAATIERLIQVGYARRSGKSIVSTVKGQRLIDVVPPEIASAVTTGRWERALAKMTGFSEAAVRAEKTDKFMQSIRRFTTYLVDAAKNADRSVKFERENPKQFTKKKTSSASPRRTRKAPAKPKKA